MIAELGHFSLVLALALGVVLGLWPLAGAHRGRVDWMAVATPAAYLQLGALTMAYGCLTIAFLQADFSVALVAGHAHSALPTVYRVTAVWGNHEGSILLWSLILSIWTAAVAWRSDALDTRLRARVLGVLGLLSVGFLLFTLATSNPFERLWPMPPEGQDLNPLLQDPGMIIHPPMLYMGYVGLGVAFAFALAGLLGGSLDAGWARATRPWTTAAWCFLTLGIALGSFWAYYELGWGGWWFWDPVENASFMPWLVATALMHSLAVSEKRGSFKGWTALLAILAFSLALLGTFIVRSGVLSSVHAFATDPARGLFILLFMVVVVGAALGVFAWRAPSLGRGAGFGVVSREGFLLTNNLLLLVATAAVLLGTVYPLVVDALGLGKLSVGPPYFNAVFVPLMVPALLMMGPGPLARWRDDELIGLARRLVAPAVVTVMATALVAWWLQGVSWLVAMGLALAFWVAASTGQQVWSRWSLHGGRGLWARARAQPASFYGMACAHLGVAVFVLGVTVVSGHHTERDVRMAPGEFTELAGYRFEMTGLEARRGPNFAAVVASIQVTEGGRLVSTLRPARRVYDASRMPMTEVAIDRQLSRDLYVALGESLGDGAWSLRVHHKPLVNTIWLGCLLMAAGGVWALWGRVRQRQRAQAALRPALSNEVVWS